MIKVPSAIRAILINGVVAAIVCAGAVSCSVYSDIQVSKPENILKLETRLTQAGFRHIPIDTPEQDGAVAQLPLYRLNRYDSATGSVFWYADPTVCHCLYQGDEQVYQRYVDILQQEQETAEYVNDVSADQVAYLSPFGYAFPPPLLWGGWPILIPEGHGGFRSPPPVIIGHPGGGGPGGGGGGIHPRAGGSGGGGGIHMRGGGGGGAIHMGGGGGHGRR